MSDTTDSVHAGEGLLRSLRSHGVKYLFANLGTDHTPLLEAHARLEEAGDLDAIPEIVVVPHEFVGVSAAHGYAAVTGEPQAVLVHVDVGTQNAGAAAHNAHRANVPVFIISGLAPVTDEGHAGSRDHVIHWEQDAFDQTGMISEYCRWSTEYRPPADPDAVVARGLRRSQAVPEGPVYLSATREALESEVTTSSGRSVDVARPEAAPAGTVEEIAGLVSSSEAPLVITSHLGSPPADENVSALVDFAEAAGAGVVESSPMSLNFPRDHDLHVGFSPGDALPDADLVVIAGTSVPWVPAQGKPRADATVLQIDPDPTKSEYHHWDFRVDRAVDAGAAATLAAVADRLDGADGDGEHWRTVGATHRERGAETLATHREEGRFTADVLSDALNAAIDDSTIVLDDAVTSRVALLRHLDLTRPGSYHYKSGAGLGWAAGAAVGAKMARPDHRVIALVGDGSYVFSNPTASAWLSAAQNAPVLTVVYNNRGWNAVRQSTLAQHPEGSASDVGVVSERFDPELDLSAPATAVDAYTAVAEGRDEFLTHLEDAIDAVDSGRPAVIDARIERT